MEALMAGGVILWVLNIIFAICLIISPLIIWRNGNRTNRLITLLLLRNGTDPEMIKAVLYNKHRVFDERNIPKFDQ